MSTVIALLFSLTAAECISKFFALSKKSFSPITLLVFVLLAPFSLTARGDSITSEIAVRSLQALSPLMAAALVFSLLQVLFSLSISRHFGPLLKVFRTVWLVGFLVLVIRNFTSLASAILVEGQKP